MATSISALVTIVIKRFTIDSTELAPREKIELEKVDKIGVIWIRKAAKDDHWEFELTSPQGGFVHWHAFKSHVQVNPILHATRWRRPCFQSVDGDARCHCAHLRN
jgi:hypothetical protein